MKLLVAVDFSETTELVLRVTRRFAASLDASVWLVHVADPEPDFVGYEAGPDVVRDQVAKELRDEHRKLQALAEELREPGVDVTALLVQGPTVETLLNEADKQGADLIVVGSHGRGVVGEMLLGSVSKGLIRAGKCPVTVVPAIR
jgi:nucleotide-binding universal stress UspA family protein